MRNTLTDQHIESENDGKLAIILFTMTTSSCDRIAMHCNQLTGQPQFLYLDKNSDSTECSSVINALASIFLLFPACSWVLVGTSA
jgi:hypothetical protein